jgi:uncharacterized protein (TIGR03086 family)
VTELPIAASALQVLRSMTSLLGPNDETAQTPCRDYDVAALGQHVIDSITRISAAAGVTVAAPQAAAVAARIAAAGEATLAGWDRRGTDGEVFFAGRTLPAADLLHVIALEFVVHGWDFATAVASSIRVPDDLADDLLQLVQRTITPQSRRIAGFDGPVPINADASAFERLLAFTGRHPAPPLLHPRP